MSWSEVKHALNSSLGSGEFKALNELIRDDFTTVSDWLSTGHVPIVKSVQRGVLSATTRSRYDPYTTSISLSAVNPNKCLVIIDGTMYGGKEDSQTSYYDKSYPSIIYYSTSLNANSLSITREYYENSSGDYTFPQLQWQVIEFY